MIANRQSPIDNHVPNWYIAIMTGAEIQKKRRELGLSLGKFAKELGVPKTTLARWERAKEIKAIIAAGIQKKLKS